MNTTLTNFVSVLYTQGRLDKVSMSRLYDLFQSGKIEWYYTNEDKDTNTITNYYWFKNQKDEWAYTDGCL